MWNIGNLLYNLCYAHTVCSQRKAAMKNYVEEYLITWEKFAKYFAHKKCFRNTVYKQIISVFFFFFFSHPIISFDIKMETSNENLSSRGSIVGHGDQHLWLSVTSCFLVTPVLCLVGTYWNMWVGYWKHFFLTSFCTWNTANTLPRTQSEHGWADADQTV